MVNTFTVPRFGLFIVYLHLRKKSYLKQKLVEMIRLFISFH